MLAVLTVGILVTASCRMAAYTAPLVPRFTPSAATVTSTIYTNAAYQTVFLSGSVDLTDLLGDAGYQAYVDSVSLYFRSTNIGSTENSGTENADKNSSDYGKIVKKADAKVSLKTTVKYKSGLNSGLYAGLSGLTNTAAYSYIKAIYTIRVVTDDGRTGYTLDDYSKLSASVTTTVANTP